MACHQRGGREGGGVERRFYNFTPGSRHFLSGSHLLVLFFLFQNIAQPSKKFPLFVQAPATLGIPLSALSSSASRSSRPLYSQVPAPSPLPYENACRRKNKSVSIESFRRWWTSFWNNLNLGNETDWLVLPEINWMYFDYRTSNHLEQQLAQLFLCRQDMYSSK